MSALRDLIVHRLKGIGVGALFGVPGGAGNLDLIDAAGRVGLPFVLTATETGGALASLAQTEVTHRPGACLTTLGPGAASVANGVACAWLDRAPLLVFTDSHATTAAGAYEHQQFDHQALFRPITKWSGRLAPGCAQDTLDQALAAVLELPPGPVHIDCPEDFESSSAACAEPPSTATVAEPAGDQTAFASFASRARRPLAIIGLGARRPPDAPAIRRCLERRGIPAMVTYKAKGVIPDDHPCFAGVFTNAFIEQSIAGTSDLIIGIGLDPVELLPRAWTYTAPVIGLGRWRVSDRHVPFAAQLVTSIGSGIEALEATTKPSAWDLDQVRAEVARQRAAIEIAGGFTAQRVVQIAADRMARSARVTVDAGAHMLPATMLWPVHDANQMLISNGLSTMGFALPAAIGAALADRTRPVVALTGDGGLLMCAAELLTAVREKLRIIVIVFRDGSLSLIDIKQQRRRYRPAGVALGTVQWAPIAEGFGMAAFTAATEAELEQAIEHVQGSDGPSLIEATIDPSNYARTLAVVRG